jgi:hypothetical protein
MEEPSPWIEQILSNHNNTEAENEHLTINIRPFYILYLEADKSQIKQNEVEHLRDLVR